MKQTDAIVILVILIVVCFLAASAAFGQEKPEKEPWKGKLGDGTEITDKDLHAIVKSHEKWVKSLGKEGKYADLRGAHLKQIDLRGANLYKANLSNADLTNAELINTVFTRADLSNAILDGANLKEAKLIEADLKDASLSRADLSRAELNRALLSNAELIGSILNGAALNKADLSNANLGSAHLTDSELNDSILSNAWLFNAHLINAKLTGADLSNADLSYADLTKAKLTEADLRNASLNEADLSNAYLYRADLSNSDLQYANLSQTMLMETNLTGCYMKDVKGFPLPEPASEFQWLPLWGLPYYEPKAGSVPSIPSMAGLPNLEQLTFNDSPHGLVDLREGFKKLGYREQERMITYALKHTRTMKSLKSEDLMKRIEGYLNLFLFEYTSKWGMLPGRPLIILVCLIFLFSFVYMFALVGFGGDDGIWKIWIPERVRSELGKSEPKKLLICTKAIHIWGYGLYFSLLSAAHIGWRDLNVGNWIARIQPREYTLRATGWVRTVSGVQSLISVYLLALSVLTYFGRPFDQF